MRMPIATAVLLLPVAADAQVYSCDVLQHWRNAAFNGQYLQESPEVIEPGLKIVLDFQTGAVTMGHLKPIPGQPVHVAGAASIGILTGGTRELAVHTVFPSIQDPNGGVLGSIMRIEDNTYMPKGTLMTRLSCKRR